MEMGIGGCGHGCGLPVQSGRDAFDMYTAWPGGSVHAGVLPPVEVDNTYDGVQYCAGMYRVIVFMDGLKLREKCNEPAKRWNVRKNGQCVSDI